MVLASTERSGSLADREASTEGSGGRENKQVISPQMSTGLESGRWGGCHRLAQAIVLICDQCGKPAESSEPSASAPKGASRERRVRKSRLRGSESRGPHRRRPRERPRPL